MIRFTRRKPHPLLARPRANRLSASHRAETAPAEIAADEAALPESVADGFAGDEERFFSEPETNGSEFSSTLAPTAIGSTEPPGLPTEHGHDGPPDRLHRTRLRRAVVIALCASGAILLLGLTRRTTDGFHAKPSAAPAQRSAITPRAVASASPEAPAALRAPASDSAATQMDERAAAESARALVRIARSLLQAGKIRPGIAVARRALAADSSDAEPYILLAAGLQDLGDWSGAQAVFNECKARARHGSSADCRYFSSRMQ